MKQPLPKKENIEWLANTHYFLTISTFLHYPYFQEPPQKQIVLNQIRKLKQKYNIPIEAFSIQINHFHIMFYTKTERDVIIAKRQLRGAAGKIYKDSYQIKYPYLWQSVRCYFIKDDDMFWGVTGYIIGNLLKHKETNNWQELYDNPFSSFKYIADKYGFEFACNLVRNVIAVEEDAEGLVELADFAEREIIKPHCPTSAKAE